MVESLVARPSDAAEVAATLRAADETGVPVHPVGGPPYPDAPGLVLDLARLDSIVELSADDTLAVVGAGLPISRLAAEAATVGLDYPQALTAPTGTTVGGALARGGVRSSGWGPDREQALGLRVALADGRLIDVGSRAIKNQTGYNLTQLVVGGRGALGVIVQATLRLWPRLLARRTLLAWYPDAAAGSRAAVAAATLPLPPAAVELLDAAALEGSSIGGRKVELESAALLVLVAGSDQSEVEARGGAVAACLGEPGGSTVTLLDDRAADAAWESRRETADRLSAAWPDLLTVEVGVPIDRVESLVAQVRRRITATGVRLSLYGSLGLGAASVAVLDAPPSRRQELARYLVGAARAEGGQPLDAVGIGLGYEEWLSLVLPASSAAALRRVRSALDPRGTLRPART